MPIGVAFEGEWRGLISAGNADDDECTSVDSDIQETPCFWLLKYLIQQNVRHAFEKFCNLCTIGAFYTLIHSPYLFERTNDPVTRVPNSNKCH